MTLPAQSLPEAPEAPETDRDVSPPTAFIAVVAVSALVVILCVLGAAMSGLFNFSTSADESAQGEPTQSVGDSAAREPATTFPDGQWLVGGDIRPGTYAVTVAAGSGCTWERNASTDGNASSVLESGNGKPADALVVSIKETDKVFQSKGCGTWQRTSD